MANVWDSQVDSLLSVGIKMTDVCLENWALTSEQSIKVLERLKEMGVPVLGGDVCEYIDGILQPNYDSWHIDRLPDESDSDFLARSIDLTLKYVRQYKLNSKNQAFFALVPEV